MSQQFEYVSTKPHIWVRSEDGIIAGVCAGIAESFKVDPWLIRLVWIALVLCFGTGLLLYPIAAFCLPKQSEVGDLSKKKLLGVCGRISRKLDIEVGVVRIAAVFLALFSFGATIMGYIILHFLLEPKVSQPFIEG